MDSLNYLSLISALNSSSNVQQLYSNYDPYSAANLYGSDDSSTSFHSIFGSCINALQSSNTSLLSELGSSLENGISETDAAQFIEKLEEASHDTCDCKSAELVKELYSAYVSDTVGYAKNRFNSLISALTSGNEQITSADNTQKRTSSVENSSTARSIQSANADAIEASIPTEEEIDALIASSLASIPA